MLIADCGYRSAAIRDQKSAIVRGGRRWLCIGALFVMGWPFCAAAQDDRDDDSTKLPGDIDRLYRLGHWESTEKLMREAVAKDGSDRNRSGLVNVLYRARKYDECMKECELLAGTKDPALRALALAIKGMCAWKKGDAAGARTWCDQATAIADAKAANAYPAARRIVRMTLAFSTWKWHESKHFIVIHPAGSPLASDLASFEAKLEAAYAATVGALDTPLDDRIEVYCFTDQRHADDVLGVPLSFTVARERAMYVLPTSSLGHGIAHVVSFWTASRRDRERPRSVFLREGVACAFACERLWDDRMAEVPPALVREGRLSLLTELLSRDASGAEFTATSGAFVRWLRESRGAEKFLKLWTEYNDHVDPWMQIYGEKIDAIDVAWRRSLKP